MFALLLLYFLRFSAGTLISHHRDSGACFKQFIPAHTGFPNARCRFPLGGNPAIKGSFIRNVYTCCRRKQAHGWGYSSLCTSCSAIRGFLYPWSEWSICSKTCSSGEQHRFRICSNGVCPGVKGRRIMETRKCLWSACCPVDGKWDTWSSWSLCSATCGSGLQHRTRSCSSPAPSCGGKACSSYPRQLRRCNVGFCANWSSWQTMSLCGVTCGEGIQHRVRKCHNPLGDECKGENESYFPCVVGSCAVNGGWCSWGSWSSCTSSCRNVMGTRKRARACSCPAPKDGGRDCEGDDGDVERCSTNAECSVNGEWSRWSSWGECSAKKCSFVSGIQKRFRECNKPLPRNNGLPCFGFAIDNRGCLFMDSCKVNAVYGKWSQWTPCSATCGLCGVKSRTRRCFSPFDSKKLFRTINVIGNPVLDCDVSATSSVARCHFGRCPDGSFPCGHEPIKILDTTSHLTTEIPSSTILFTPSNDPTTSLTTAPHDNSNYSEITTDQKRKYTSTLLNKVTGVKQVISQVLRSTSTASVQHTTAEDKSNSYDKLFSTEMLARYSTTSGTTLYVSNGETSVPIKSGSQNTKQKQEGIPASTKSYLRFAESEQHMPQKIKGLHTDITDSPVKFRLSTEPRGTITLSTANLQNFKQPESTIADDLPIKILQQNWPEASADANYDVENTYSNNFNEQMIQKGKNPSLNEDFSIINNFEDDQVFESPPEMFRKETFSGDSAFIDREIAEDKLLKGHREEINPMIKSTDPSPSQSYKHLSGHRDPLDPTNGMDKHILPDKINLILGKTEFETDDPLIDEDLSNLIVAVNGYESQDVAHERAELENKWEAELTEKVDIKRDVNGKYDPDEDRVLKYFLLGNNDEELRNENNKAITDQPKSTEEDSSESNHAKDEDHEALLHFFHINNHVLSKENYENVKQGNISLEQNVNASTVNINRNENVAQTKKSRNHTGQFTIEGEGYEKNTTGSTANSEEEYQYNYHKKYNDSVSLHKKQYMYSKEKELHEQHEQLLQFFGLNKSEISGAKETVLKIASDKEPISLNGDSIPTSEDSITYEEDYPDYDIPVAGEEINMEYDGYYEEDNNYYNYNNYKNQEEYNDNDEDIQTEDTDSIVPNSDYTVVDNAVLKLVFSDDEDFIPNSGLSFSGESERTANRNKNPGDKKDKKRDRKLSKLFNNLREITKKRKERRKNKEDNNNYENNEEIVTFTEESTACEEMGNFPPNAVMNASECCTLMGSGMNETNGTEKGQQLETCMMNFYDSSPLTDVTAKAVGQCRYKVNTRFLTTICCAKTSCTLWNHGGLRAQCYNCKRLCPPCTQMLLNG